MKLGNQLYAPEGYKKLSKGRTYHFVHSDVEGERVYLVSFGTSSRAPPSAVHGHARGNALQRPNPRVLPTPGGRWQAQEGGLDRVHAQTDNPPQCDRP